MISVTVHVSDRFIPESARWLLERGRAEEAKQLITKVAAINKRTISDSLLEKVWTLHRKRIFLPLYQNLNGILHIPVLANIWCIFMVKKHIHKKCLQYDEHLYSIMQSNPIDLLEPQLLTVDCVREILIQLLCNF